MAIAAAVLTLLVPYLLHVFDHGDIEQAQSLCPFKMLTGLPCPGCGITKSLIFLYQGDIGKSFRYHLFGPPLVLFCILVVLFMSVELITSKNVGRALFYNKTLAYTLALVLGIYHLIRLSVFLSTTSLSSILKDSIWR